MKRWWSMVAPVVPSRILPLLLLGQVGCLQQEDLSTDILTSFKEPTPGAKSASGAEGDHSSVPHVDMPPGGPTNVAINGGTPAPGTGSGTASSATTAEGPVDGSPVLAEGVPEVHVHVEMPDGAGSKLPPEGRPEAVPLPPGEAAKTAPTTGEPEQVRPAVLTPFDKACQETKCITLTGTISVVGVTSGTVDLDCFVVDTSTRAGRKLVNKAKLDAPGTFSIKIPANYGDVALSAFIDVKADGPDSTDPQGSYAKNPLSIKDKDLSGIDLELKAASSKPK